MSTTTYATPRRFASINDFAEAQGTMLGLSSWYLVEQTKVDAFADATGDRQWIHVDPARAAEGPFGGTVAHGYLTLALLPVMVAEIYRVDRLRMAVNYGLDRVRFPTPLLVGARIRAATTLASVTPVQQGFRASLHTEVSCDAGGKPVCVADTLTLLVPQDDQAYTKEN